ncbi:unnamed protein product, partial [Symbiodinium sp. CCMP2456]
LDADVAPNAHSAIPEMYAVLLLSLAAATGAAWVEDTFFTGQLDTSKVVSFVVDVLLYFQLSHTNLAGGKFAMTADGSVIAGAGHNSYWVSTDSGATWTRRSPMEKQYESRSVLDRQSDREGRREERTMFNDSPTLEPDVQKVTGITSRPRKALPFSADGSKLVAGGIEVNMWKSDGGPTFQTGLSDAQFPSSTSQKLRDLAMSPDGNIIVSAGDTSDVDAQTWTQGSFRTTDFGANWNQISTTPMTGIAMSADGNVIAAVTSQSNAGVRVSTDGGANWATNTPSESTSLHAIAMTSDGSIMAAVGHGNGGIWISNITLAQLGRRSCRILVFGKVCPCPRMAQ